MNAVRVILQGCLMLSRADNEKLHIEFQSLWYTHGMSANFSLTFENDGVLESSRRK